MRFLGSSDADFHGIDGAADFRDALRAEPKLLILFGSEFRGHDIDALVSFGLSLSDARFACLADYANSRGAADMGLLPDLLPGYRPVTAPGPFAEEYPNLPQKPGKDLIEMFDAAERGELGALYVDRCKSSRTLQRRSSIAEEHLRHRAGDVPHRNRADRGCRPARCQPI